MQKGEVGKWIRVKTIFNAMGLTSGGVGSNAEVDLIAYFRSTVHEGNRGAVSTFPHPVQF